MCVKFQFTRIQCSRCFAFHAICCEVLMRQNGRKPSRKMYTRLWLAKWKRSVDVVFFFSLSSPALWLLSQTHPNLRLKTQKKFDAAFRCHWLKNHVVVSVSVSVWCNCMRNISQQYGDYFYVYSIQLILRQEEVNENEEVSLPLHLYTHTRSQTHTHTQARHPAS